MTEILAMIAAEVAIMLIQLGIAALWRRLLAGRAAEADFAAA